MKATNLEPRLAIVGVQSWAGLTWHPIIVYRSGRKFAVARHLDAAFSWSEEQIRSRVPLESVRFVEGPLTLEQSMEGRRKGAA